MIAALAYLGWKERYRNDYPLLLSFGLLVLVILQAAFGMWTVTMKLLAPGGDPASAGRAADTQSAVCSAL